MATLQPHYPALTGIRAVAAYMVFAHHFNPVSVTASPFMHHLINEMHIGVSVFFVLSGFLITTRYDNQAFSWTHFASYLRNRAARIYPLFFLLVTASFVVEWYNSSSAHFDTKGYLMSITLLKGFFNEWKFSGIAQSWSLTVEECFYLAAPFVFLIVKKIRRLWIVLVLLASGVLFTLWKNDFATEDLFLDARFFLVYTFAGTSFEFFVGILLAHYVQQQSTAAQGSRFTLAGFLFTGVCILTMAFVSFGHQVSVDTLAGIVLNNFVLPIAVATLFLGLVTEKTVFARMLSTPAAQYLGKSSFAFYLIHLGFIQLTLQRYITTNVVLLFVILNLVALALYFVVERPMHRLLRANAPATNDL